MSRFLWHNVRLFSLQYVRERTGCKGLCQNVSNVFRGDLKVVFRPFMKHAEGAADGAGNHIGQFLFAVSGGCDVLRHLPDIVMEHGHRLLKKSIFPRAAQDIGQKRIGQGILTDC